MVTLATQLSTVKSDRGFAQSNVITSFFTAAVLAVVGCPSPPSITRVFYIETAKDIIKLFPIILVF